MSLITDNEEKFVAVHTKSVNYNQGYYAIIDNRVVGLIGLNTKKNKFENITFKIFLASFGFFGGLWRYIYHKVYLLFSSKPKLRELNITCVAVDKLYQGTGIGSLLFEEVFCHAKENNISKISLEVVNTNPKAKKLYELLGFVKVKEKNFGFITKNSGFTSVIYMNKTL